MNKPANDRTKNDSFPHEVVGFCIEQGMSLPAAWRHYRKLTQAELAARMGITQAAVAQLEKPSARLRKGTLEKLAAALGVQAEQLVDSFP